MQKMEKLIADSTSLVFDNKEKIDEGDYLQLMNNLNEMYKLKDVSVKPVAIARTIPTKLKAWILNKKGSTYSGSLSTNDGELYSYNLLIGYTSFHQHEFTKYVMNHTAKGLGFVSQTTSTHVGKCIKFCEDHNVLHTIINE